MQSLRRARNQKKSSSMKHWKNGGSRLGGECMVREVYWHDLLVSLYIHIYKSHIQSRGFLGGRATHRSNGYDQTVRFIQADAKKSQAWPMASLWDENGWNSGDREVSEGQTSIKKVVTLAVSWVRSTQEYKYLIRNTTTDLTVEWSPKLQELQMQRISFIAAVSCTWIWWSFGTPIRAILRWSRHGNPCR